MGDEFEEKRKWRQRDLWEPTAVVRENLDLNYSNCNGDERVGLSFIEHLLYARYQSAGGSSTYRGILV